MNRKVEVELFDLLELISCAEDYGFWAVVPDLKNFAGDVTEEEIEAYARNIENKDGYGKEDYINIKGKLIEEFGL